MENRKLTLVKAKGRGAAASCEEIEKDEDGGRDGEGKTVAKGGCVWVGRDLDGRGQYRHFW